MLDLGPTLVPYGLILTSCVCRHPVSKQGHVLRFGTDMTSGGGGPAARIGDPWGVRVFLLRTPTPPAAGSQSNVESLEGGQFPATKRVTPCGHLQSAPAGVAWKLPLTWSGPGAVCTQRGHPAINVLPSIPSGCPRVCVFICPFWGLQKREGLLHSSHVTEELTTTTE